MAAAREVEDLVDLDLVADPDAAAAQDALVEVPLDHRVGAFDPIAGGVDVETGLLDPEPIDQVLQFAGAVLLAHQAVVVSRGPEQLDDQPLRGAHLGGVGLDDHAGADRHAAGGDQRPGLFDFDDADAAGADVRRFGVVAECRNVNALLPGHLQNRPAGRRFDSSSVNGDRNWIVHALLLSYRCATILYVNYDIRMVFFLPAGGDNPP